MENTRKKTKIKPKKRLGQNFLYESGVIKKLAAAAQITPDFTILEIGPGTGNLTEELAKNARRLICVEKDAEMAKICREKFGNLKNVEILKSDILDFDENKIAAPYKIAANLPFYAAAPIIRKFLESQTPPQSITVILQKEVAQRICAHPPKMNLLAISVQFYADAKIISYVSKGSFWPAPRVDGAIIQITPETNLEKGEERKEDFVKIFFKIVKAGFSHPRKQLAGNLAAGLGISKEASGQWLISQEIKPNRRAETLSREEWQKLANSFYQKEQKGN